MIRDLLDFAQHNQILVGGVGTVVFSSLMYLVRNVPAQIYDVVKRMLTVEISLNSSSFLYHEILDVLSEARVQLFARSYTTDQAGEVVAGFGNSFAIFAGKPVLFTRAFKEGSLRLDETLNATLYTRDIDVLRQIIAKARKPKDQDYVKIYNSSGGWWDSPVKRRKRTLETIFANGDLKQKMVARIEKFLSEEEWYLRCGITYKLVFLLHGAPGTGKSSLVYGMASHFGRGLGNISGVSGMDKTLRDLPENTFAVVEDIDMISVSREEDDDDEGKPARGPTPTPTPKDAATSEKQMSALQVLVNALDGLNTPHGLVLFMTTNFREKLDPALVRPGRVDCDLEIEPLEADAVEQMFAAFYGRAASHLVRPVTSSRAFRPCTGADLQQIFMLESAESAVRILRSQMPHIHEVHA